MIFAIDHIVFAATARQRAELIATLQGCGFPPVDFHLDFPDIGGASDSVGMRGGSSLEFVYPTSWPGQPGSSASGAGPDTWFAEVPRVIGLGFASDSFDADTDWDGDPGAWTMPAQQGFPNSAGPHEHHSDFYVFVMNRKDGLLQFPELASAPAIPRLARITLTGQAAGQWRERLSRWLRLPAAGDGLAAGSTELAFADGPGASVRAALTFEVTGGPAVLPLAAGELRLVREPAP